MSTKRPGRPPVDPTDRSVLVTIRLPSRAYDRQYQRAQRERVTIAEAIRRTLKDGEADDTDDE